MRVRGANAYSILSRARELQDKARSAEVRELAEMVEMLLWYADSRGESADSGLTESEAASAREKFPRKQRPAE